MQMMCTAEFLKLLPDFSNRCLAFPQMSVEGGKGLQLVKTEITKYHAGFSDDYQAVCRTLAHEIDRVLVGAESKIWHAHPVWFLDGNPIVGYSMQKAGIRLMFWSGAGFR
jgi:hypothetical protein